MAFETYFHLDRQFKHKLNEPRSFVGTVVNRSRISKTAAERVGIWNKLHPEDPVEG
jgi:hypothetical protein